MKPTDVRSRVLEDHAAICEMLVSLESLAGRVLEEPTEYRTPLREDAELLLAHLSEHMYWEDVHLEPLLKANGDTARASRLSADHAEQRDLLEHALRLLRDRERPISLVAKNVIDLISLLREDIRDEERHLLGVES